MTIAYLDCFSGISGDMFLAALVDAGVPFSTMQKAVEELNIGATLTLRRVDRSGIDAAKVDVLTASGEFAEKENEPEHSTDRSESTSHTHAHGSDGHSHDHGSDHSHDHARHSHGRSLSVIRGIIDEAPLPPEAKTLAVKAFELLGQAEAKIHNVPIEGIHFHEVGAVDAIADIVGVSAGCHWLAKELGGVEWISSPLNVGGGHVHCAHGTFPVPAPATLALLKNFPVYSSGIKKELVTPTGAALLRALQVTSSDFPAMRMISTGYGAGSRDLPGAPNVLRLVIGDSLARSPQDDSCAYQQDRIGIIETTIDDATPELLSYVAEKLLAAGASDVYRTPIHMKKGRGGVQLTVLCSPAKADGLRRLVFSETTTLGLRYREEEKYMLQRNFISVKTQWGPIRIKTGSLATGEVLNSAPEFEECRAIAHQHSIPLKEVMQAAMSSFRTRETTS